MAAPKRTRKDWWMALPGLALVAICYSALTNDAQVNWLQFAMAVAGVALLAWGYWLADKGRAEAFRRQRDVILATLGIMGAAAYCNFGHQHWTNFIHIWDTYHYYIGAKYFPELGYERLYDCTAVADVEAGFKTQVQARVMTDLRTNVMVSAAPLVDHPELCKQYFTTRRWEDFKHDIAFFRSRVGFGKWEQIQKDHGYNATPVWNALGSLLANSGPATQSQVDFLCLLDPLFLLATFLMIWWAFGWRVTAIAALYFGIDIPGRYLWTGGAYLRHDWLFWMVASICLLKKEKYAASGATIAYSTLLRLFPGLLIAGPLFAFIQRAIKAKKLERPFIRYVAGGTVTAVLLVLISLAASGGPSSWVTFARNTSKHAATPLTNHMGLRTLLSYRPSTIGAVLVRPGTTDPWALWKQARVEKFDELKPLFYLLCLGFLALLWFAVEGSGSEPWLGAALGTVMIAVGSELTCYYYCFFIGLAVAAKRRREVGVLVILMAAVWLFIDRAPLPWMRGGQDEQYVAMTVAALVAGVAILWGFTKWGERYALLPEPKALPEGVAVAPTPIATSSNSTKVDRKEKKKRAR
ncbi:MAG: hypothetical protein ACJ790_22525 [Myxococcaceae bacterium]